MAEGDHQTSRSTDPGGSRDEELFRMLCKMDPHRIEALVLGMVGDESPELAEKVGARLKTHRTYHPTITLDGNDESSVPTVSLKEPGVGTVVGPFRLERVLGRGGMGTVYEAVRHDDLELRVALKILGARQPRLRDLFQKECKILSGLRHPHIAHLIDAGMLPTGQPWLAMEFVEGRNMDVWLKDDRPDLRQRLEFFAKVCDAVSHAHGQMVIHRDLKPSNIMVTAAGDPKLLDFGIAATLDPETGLQHTIPIQAGNLMTPDYASPEQINGYRLTAASDVYSLGVLLYEMLCDHRPYQLESRNILELARHIQQTPITKPSNMPFLPDFPIHGGQLRGDLDTMVMMALDREPKQRYQSVEALGDDVRRFLFGMPVKARPATPAYRLRKFIARRPWPVAAALAIVVFTALFAVYADHQRRQIRQERDTARQVSGFLVSLFEQVDPDLSRRGEVTALEVLEQGRLQLESVDEESERVPPNLLTTMGRVYRALGRFDESDRLFSRAGEWESDPIKQVEARLEQIRSLQEGSRFSEARILLDELAPAGDPRLQAMIHYLHGAQWKSLGNLVQAREALELVEAEHMPEHFQNYFIEDQAEILDDLGFYEESRARIEELLRTKRAKHGERHSETARVLDMMGSHLRRVGAFEESGQYHDRARAILRDLYGERNPAMIGNAVFIATNQLYRGNYGEAQKILDQAAELTIELFDQRHPLLAFILETRAELDLRRADYVGAEKHYRRAMDIYIKNMGRKTPRTGNCINGLALVFHEQGKTEEALRLARESYQLHIDIFGKKHPTTATVADNLANLLYQQREMDTAERLFREILPLRIELLGKDHPSVATSLNNLASLRRRRGDLDEAETLYKRALDIRIRRLGDKHPRVGTSYNNLATLLHAKGDYRGALEAMERALAINISIKGEDHPSVATAYNNLAFVSSALGEYAQGAEYGRRALDIRLRIFGRQNISSATSYSALAKIQMRAGNLRQALPLAREGVAILAESYGEDHPEFINARLALAEILFEMGDYAGVDEQMSRVDPIIREVHGERHRSMAQRHWLQGRAYAARDLMSLAEQHYQQALTAAEHRPAAAFKTTLGSLCALADLYVGRQRLEEAKALVARAAAMAEERDDDRARTQVQITRARVAHGGGLLEQARGLLVDQLERQAEQLPPLHYALLPTILELARVELALGQPTRARARLEAAKPILVELPAEHVRQQQLMDLEMEIEARLAEL